MNLLNRCHAHHLGDNQREFECLGIHRRGRLLIVLDEAGRIELVVCVDAVLLLHLLFCRPVDLAHLALGRAKVAFNLAGLLAYVPKLILGNAPIIENQRLHTVREFAEMVAGLNSRYKLKINGTPLGDPDIGSPFAIMGEPDLLAKLPRVEAYATIITGSIAARPIQKILDACGNRSWVYGTNKEIACLPHHNRRSEGG